MTITLDGTNGITTPSIINGMALRQGVLDPENRIINGAFDFWQRGTSFSSYSYGADRWLNIANGGATQSRQAFTLGETLGTNNPTYFLRQTVSGQSAVTNYAHTTQRIESVRSYAGKTITVLGWARRSSGSGNTVLEIEQNFGTTGSPSSAVRATSTTTTTLTDSYAPFAIVIDIPSITGKTLGTDNNDYLSLNFWTSAGSNFNSRTNSLGLQDIAVDFWGIHVKVGTHTTDAVNLYKQPELEAELARCQRYYEKHGPNYRVNIGTTTNSSTTITQGMFNFAAPKRVNPTVAYGGAWRTLGANQGASISALTFGEASLISVSVTGTGTYTQGQANYIQTTDAATGFITIDAEL